MRQVENLGRGLEPVLHSVGTWFWHNPATPMLGLTVGALTLALAIAGLFRILGFWRAIDFPWLRESAGRWLETVDLALCHWAAFVLDRPLRWLYLVAISATVLVLGIYLPPACALLVLGAGLGWSYAVYRLWSSDEEDRSKDLVGPHKRVALTEDVGHEVWFTGIIAILIFPIVFYQVDLAAKGAAFEVPARYGHFAGYFAYLAAEIQRITPTLREGELLHLQLFADIEQKNWMGRWTTLFFRLSGDVLIIAVILKIFAIASRMRTGQDLRRQDALLARQDDRAAEVAITDLTAFVIRFDRLNALNRLADIGNPPAGQTELPFHVRVRACEALQGIAVVRARFGATALQSALLGYQAIVSAINAEDDLRRWAHVEARVAQVQMNLGVRFSGMAGLRYLEQSIHTYDGALVRLAGDSASSERFEIVRGLAVVLRIFAEQRGGDGAVDALRRAVGLLTEAAASAFVDPAERATINSDLGECLVTLGERLEGDEGLSCLERAVDAHRSAVAHLDRRLAPNTWAVAQNALGTVLVAVGARQEGPLGLQQLLAATEAYERAASVFTKRSNPLNWAWIQTNLGSAFKSLAEKSDPAPAKVYFGRSTKFYEGALRVRTEKDTPMDWAWTQTCLSSVLRVSAARLAPSAAARQLDRAILGHFATFRVYNAETSSVAWAIAKMNLGLALAARGLVANSAARVDFERRAHIALVEAQSVLTEQHFLGYWVEISNAIRNLESTAKP